MEEKNVVDFSTKGSEYTKTYIELPEFIVKNKNCKSRTMYINSLPPRRGKTYILKLEQQLQAYKDKEDKVRDFIAEEDIFKPNMDSHRIETDYIKCNKDILQILDERSDE